MNVIVSFILISTLSGISTLKVIPQRAYKSDASPEIWTVGFFTSISVPFFVTSAALVCFGVKNTAKANRADSNKNNFFFIKILLVS